MRQPARGEDGQSLLIALAFLAFISLIVTALLQFGFASVKATATIRTNRSQAYDADAAMDAAIAKIRTKGNWGFYDGSAGSHDCGAVGDPYSFSWTSVNLSGVVLRVDCKTRPASANQQFAFFTRHVTLAVCPQNLANPCPDP